MNQSESVGELAKALSKAQGLLRGAVKDSKNPFYKSSYADLGSVWEACRAPLSDCGLSVAQTLGFIPNVGITLITTLLHESGQWVRGEMPICPVKQDPQGIGSAISYARRYSLAAMVGVIQVDDDGESAMDRIAVVSPKPKITPVVEVKPVVLNREELNKELMRLYKPFMKVQSPSFEFKELLKIKYGVEETKLMTLEQIQHLINLMKSELGEA